MSLQEQCRLLHRGLKGYLLRMGFQLSTAHGCLTAPDLLTAG